MLKKNITLKRVFTTGDAASICGLSLQTIIRCFDSGRLKGFRVPGSRFRRIPREDLIAFMRENNILLENLLAAPRKILIVDDDLQLSDMLSDYLAAVGKYEIKQAATGFDAGVITQKFLPDVILLDVMLPDINGREVCKIIKNNPDTAGTKVIIISGMIEDDKIKHLFECGADEYFKKPFNLAKLASRIEQFFGQEQLKVPSV